MWVIEKANEIEATGSSKPKVAPLPNSLCTEIVPRCSWTMLIPSGEILILDNWTHVLAADVVREM